jgi:hypothetical protein
MTKYVMMGKKVSYWRLKQLKNLVFWRTEWFIQQVPTCCSNSCLDGGWVLIWCHIVWWSSPTFWRNVLPPSSRSTNSSNKKPAKSRQKSCSFLLCFIFQPRSSVFLQNVCGHLLDYGALHPRKQQSSVISVRISNPTLYICSCDWLTEDYLCCVHKFDSNEVDL